MTLLGMGINLWRKMCKTVVFLDLCIANGILGWNGPSVTAVNVDLLLVNSNRICHSAWNIPEEI